MITGKEAVTRAMELIGLAYKWAGDFSGPEDTVTKANVRAWRLADPAHFSAEKCLILLDNFLNKQAGDCSGLITHTLGMPKTQSGVLFSLCTDRQKFDPARPLSEQIPGDPGVIVWRLDHIGLSKGDGYIIESGSTKYGVKATPLDKPITGKPWTHYGYLRQQIDYTKQDEGGTIEMIKKGDTGPAVDALKINLNSIGYNLPLDSIFDAATDETLRYEQKNNGLPATGILDGPTALKIAEMIYNKMQEGKAPTPIYEDMAAIKAITAKY